MRDFRKFCRPNTIKNPKIGDVEVSLNCGETVFMDAQEYKSVQKFFKNATIIESNASSTKAGNIKTYSTSLGRNFILSPSEYSKYKDFFEFVEVIKEQKNPSDGDILVHNDILDMNSIFSYNDWIDSEDSWDAYGLQNIETFGSEDEVTEDRYVIQSNGTTFIIKAEDYSKINSGWEIVDTIEYLEPITTDPTA